MSAKTNEQVCCHGHTGFFSISVATDGLYYVCERGMEARKGPYVERAHAEAYIQWVEGSGLFDDDGCLDIAGSN